MDGGVTEVDECIAATLWKVNTFVLCASVCVLCITMKRK
jgi:hypothetical protein